jgi:hypothetical protein
VARCRPYAEQSRWSRPVRGVEEPKLETVVGQSTF